MAELDLATSLSGEVESFAAIANNYFRKEECRKLLARYCERLICRPPVTSSPSISRPALLNAAQQTDANFLQNDSSASMLRASLLFNELRPGRSRFCREDPQRHHTDRIAVRIHGRKRGSAGLSALNTGSLSIDAELIFL